MGREGERQGWREEVEEESANKWNKLSGNKWKREKTKRWKKEPTKKWKSVR